jgi:hypothetical protein
LTDERDGIRVKTRASMPKKPTPDADPADRKVDVVPDGAGGSRSAAGSGGQADAGGARPPADDNTAPSLVWPPVDDELSGWEVVHLEAAGPTVIEPMKVTPPASPPSGAVDRRPPPTPAPYVPPAPIDDPVGDMSLLPISSDFELPETELIEPLTLHPTLPTERVPAWADAGRSADAAPPTAAPDDRTVVIPRPAAFAQKPEPPAPAVVHDAVPPPSHEDTNPGIATRILVAPAFAASVGHAPTVPVSALHRATRPQATFGPRRPMEDTLPAGVTRELLAGEADADSDTATVRSDDTVTRFITQSDTHPVPSPVARRASAGPSGPPSPFSRVPSRGPQPLVESAPAPEPAPISLAPPPLAFGPRVPAAAPAGHAGPATGGGLPMPPIAAPSVAASGLRAVPIPTRPAPTSTRMKLLSLGAAVAVVLLLALGVYQVLSMRSTSAAGPGSATLSVESTPAGATVLIDGTPRGKTPLRLELSEGGHKLDVSHAGATRHVPLTLAAGTITAHSFEFAAAPAPVAADAAIEVRSEPAGARVLVDGVARGTTPIVVTGLTAGRHEVQVGGPFRTVTKTVTLAAKEQLRFVATPARTASPESESARPARAAAGTGFIAIQSPIVLRVVRNGDFVGTSEDARLSLPVGPQVIGLENESVGFRDVRTVDVIAGKVTPVPVVLPKGEISINARPWAEVFVDGNRIGETPVSQLSLPVGIHEILFRHPDFGERRASVVVKIGATGRAFTDFTK